LMMEEEEEEEEAQRGGSMNSQTRQTPLSRNADFVHNPYI